MQEWSMQFLQMMTMQNGQITEILYGSDFPYTNLIKPRNDAYEICAQSGLLDPEKVDPLKEIRAWNPLLANYIFTKNLELETENGEKLRFPNATFTGEFKDTNLILI